MKTLLILLALGTMALAQAPQPTPAIPTRITLDTAASVTGKVGEEKQNTVRCNVSAFPSGPVEVTLFCRFLDKNGRTGGSPADLAIPRAPLPRELKTLKWSGVDRREVEFNYTTSFRQFWFIQAYVGEKLVAWKASESLGWLEQLSKTPVRVPHHP